MCFPQSGTEMHRETLLTHLGIGEEGQIHLKGRSPSIARTDPWKVRLVMPDVF